MISNVTSTYAVSAPATYQPVGRQVVGQESSDLKLSSFRATEQLADSSRQQAHRGPEDRPSQDQEESRVSAKKPPVDENQQRKQKAQKQQQEAEQKVIEQLSSRDREVRAHEQAHAAVGGQYASSPTYTYQRGPDGVSYAVGGEVQIDTSPIPGDPEATLRKAEQIARAASAPAEPSGQDRAVAAQAAKMAQQARVEISQKVSERLVEQPQDKEVVAQEAASAAPARQSEATENREKEKSDEKSLEDQELQSQRQAERTRLLTEVRQKKSQD
ncbi:MAG: catalase [Cellvibrio sp.]|nr:catalase [Cellvibrio sp.]